MKRVALFFGSFNPIHNGHIHIAQEVLRQQKADEVQFVLSPQNPHKPATELLPEHHRWNMLQLALESHPKMIPNDIELHLPKPSYTAATLQKLTQENPDTTFLMVLGADTAASLPSWKNADYLMQFPCIVYPRKGIALENNASETVLQNVSLQDISATQIRLEKKGNRLKNWLPESVFAYIQTHQLFSDT